ncbi:MAG: hypothetical protein N2Z84_05495, partial [Atribacterota bacterium]|nr:hypothetical protein [Atribacterota bacterium]
MSLGYVRRRSFAKIPSCAEIPDLIEIQRDSFHWFLQADVAPQERKRQGLQEVFLEIFPIQDFTGNLTLEFLEYRLEEPPLSIKEAKEKGRTYAAPLYVRVRLI